MRFVLLLGLLVLASACDSAPPLDPSNPYDPAFTGQRIPGAPANTQVASTSPTSITITWEDRSSFEGGYRVLEVYRYPSSQYPQASRVAADLPADTESFVIDSLVADGAWPNGARRFTVVARPPEGGADVPGDTVTVRYPYSVTAVLQPNGYRIVRGIFSDTNETFYASAESSVDVFDVPTGQRLYRATNVHSPLTLLLDDRVIGQVPANSGNVPQGSEDQVVFVTLSRTGEDRRLRVGGPPEDPNNPGHTCFFRPSSEGPPAPARGGRRAAGSCIGGLATLLVWDLETGLRLDTGPRRQTFNERVVAMSPAGTELVVYSGSDDELVLYDVATGLPRWSRTGISPVVFTVVFTDDGTRIYLTNSISVRLLDAGTGGLLATSADGVGGSVLDMDSNEIVVSELRSIFSSEVRRVYVLNASSLQTKRSVELGTVEEPRAVDAYLTPNGVAILGENNRVYEWDFTRSWEVVPD